MGGTKYQISGFVKSLNDRERFEVDNLFQVLKSYLKLKRLGAKYITLFIWF